MKVVTVAGMREIDRCAQEEHGISADALMAAAGAAVANRILEEVGPQRACIVCGKGNNAGDGFVIARELKANAVDVVVVSVGDPARLTGAAANAFRRMQAARIPVSPPDRLDDLIAGADVVVDALLGTGVRGEVAGDFRKAIEAINRAACEIVAVDVPSGVRELGAGETPGIAVDADITVTIGLPKVSLLTLPWSQNAGELCVEPINFPRRLLESPTEKLNFEFPDTFAGWLPDRPVDSNKGTFGRVGIVAGSPQCAGAAILAARAALRSGCGLVYIFTTAQLNHVYKIALPEAVTVIVPGTADGKLGAESLQAVIEAATGLDSLAVGPGIGTEEGQGILVRGIARKFRKPLVLDADALTCLAEDVPKLGKHCVLTPHPGEMARLTGESVEAIQSDRAGAARRLAAQCGANVLLKGADTVIARPDEQVWINPGATSALARGGTGDVLTGMIASFAAQGVKPWQAAVLSAHLHLQAGQLCAAQHGERGVLAGEVADAIPQAMAELEEI
jgi:NAD(P)H-hydrate epimerase